MNWVAGEWNIIVSVSISYYLYFIFMFVSLSVNWFSGCKQLPLILVHICDLFQSKWTELILKSQKGEQSYGNILYYLLAKKLSPCLLIKWNCLKGSNEQKLHSDVFVKHRIVFYYHPKLNSTSIFWSLQMKSSFAWGWFPLLTSAVELMPPLDPYWLSSLYSCGWKPTPLTPLLYGTPSDPGTY